MKAARKVEAGIELELEDGEAAFLLRLPDRLRAAIGAGRKHGGAKWLHPRLAEDHNIDASLQTLLGEEIERERMGCIDAFAADLAAVRDDSARVVLSEDAAVRWLAVLTDLRFMLAGELGIESDEDANRIVRERMHEPDGFLYAYLTALQELIIREGFGG